MIFPKRQDFLARRTGLTVAANAGDQPEFAVTREFHIEALYLRVNVTGITVATSASPNGHLDIIKRVKVIVSDGARTRNVVDASGMALIELAHNEGGLDALTIGMLNKVSNNTSCQFTIPIYFSPPQLDDPVGSMFLLPAPRFNQNISVVVTLAAQGDMDLAGPTYVATVALTLMATRRQVTIPKWPTFDQEIVESSTAYAASLTPATIDLPVPGSITGLVARQFTSTTARGDNTGGGPIGVSVLGTTLRRGLFADLQAENEMSRLASTTQLSGSVYFDFLTDKAGMSVGDVGSVLDMNALSQTGARAQFFQDVVGGAGVKTNLVYRRLFGNLAPLKRAK